MLRLFNNFVQHVHISAPNSIVILTTWGLGVLGQPKKIQQRSDPNPKPQQFPNPSPLGPPTHRYSRRSLARSVNISSSKGGTGLSDHLGNSFQICFTSAEPKNRACRGVLGKWLVSLAITHSNNQPNSGKTEGGTSVPTEEPNRTRPRKKGWVLCHFPGEKTLNCPVSLDLEIKGDHFSDRLSGS